MDKELRDDERKAEIMGVDWGKVSGLMLSFFDDQVARDLDIPFHTIGMPEFEEWHRRGFKADPKAWEEPSETEVARVNALSVGCAFRE